MTTRGIIPAMTGATVLLACLLAPAYADEAGGPSLGVTAGTLGVGIEAGYAVGERFAFRVAAHEYDLDVDGEEGGIDYDAELRLSSMGAWADWYPLGGVFRITAGWLRNDNAIDGEGRPEPGGYELGGQVFTVAETGVLHADVDFRRSAPYLGLGWRWGFEGRGLAFVADLGVLFQGSPRVTLRSVGGSLSGDPLLVAALAREEMDLEDDLDDYEYYPVAAVGLLYRF